MNRLADIKYLIVDPQNVGTASFNRAVLSQPLAEPFDGQINAL